MRSINIIKLFTGFSIIGIINTFIHTIIVIFLVEYFQMFSVYANIIGFISANIFSFIMNSKYNFKSNISLNKYIKFLSVSIVGLIVTISMSSLAELLKLHYIWGLIFIYITMPIITFIFHYKWTWKR